MGRKAKLTPVQANKFRTAISLSSSSAVSISFLLEAKQLSSCVHAGTRRRPLGHKERGKNQLRSMEEKIKCQNFKWPRIRRSTSKHLCSQGSAGDTISVFCGKGSVRYQNFLFHYSSTRLYNLGEFVSTSQPANRQQPLFSIGAFCQ